MADQEDDDALISDALMAAFAAVAEASRELGDQVEVHVLGNRPVRVMINGDPVAFRVIRV